MKQITNDLTEHFIDKLHIVVCDTANTCRYADLDAKDIMEIIIAGLMCELVKAACALHLSEEGFTDLTRTGYRMLVKKVKAAQKTT